MMNQPLAERMRPKTLDDYIGQQHLVGQGAVLRKMLDAGHVPSFILWGPPGVGKTTLAYIISNQLQVPFYTLSAISSGVKEVREVIDKAKSNRFFNTASPILFIDEIHRFSKAQQDSLLNAVETGVVTRIGATTENPSFEVIRPLLSRCQVYVLKALGKEDLLTLLKKAVSEDVVLKTLPIVLEETDALLRFSGGDARKLLNILDLVVSCTTTLFPLSLNLCAAVIRMPPSIGWRGWWQVGKIRSLLPAVWSFWLLKILGLPIRMLCCWRMPVLIP